MFTNKYKYLFLFPLFLSLIGLIFKISGATFQISAQGKPSVIPDKYIVVFKDNVGKAEDVANDMALKHGLSVDFVYGNVIKGFAATIPQARLDKIKADNRVQFVSEDREVQALARTDSVVTQPSQTTPTGINRISAPLNTNKGTGVGVAVIDTGIDLTHPDLKANIAANYSCIKTAKTGNDDNGHGSHVAGTIAATNNTIGVVGVAPEARLLAVKVLNSQGSGSWSSVICGIDWVSANAIKYNIKVANMSLGGGGSSDNNCGITNNDALHKAICKSTAAGVTYVVAAGNDNVDVNTSVPAGYDDTVITVSALVDSDGKSGGNGPITSYGADDAFASFSNFGTGVDIAAPGVNIYSTWKGGAYNTISGTSMATPHVAGSAALYIKNHSGSTWQQVRDGLVSAAEITGHISTAQHQEPVVQAGSL